jgi:2,4-didehydro-3-deoxy-L-rhamnonate hydrolase
MKFARLGPSGAERPVVADRTTGAWLDLSPITPDLDEQFFGSDGISRVREALESGSLTPLDGADDLRVGAPIARPSAVVCIGMNYAAHVVEAGAPTPASPVVFLKTPNTVVGPYDDVAIPRGSERTDWEVELGVVIGRRTSYLTSPDESLSHVAGFVTTNDLTERAYQFEESGGQWSKGKCAAGFCPVGPWLITPDEVEHQDVRVRTAVNGEPRQDSSTKDQIFGVAEVIHHLSQYLVLEPGDLVLTGTPQGVAMSGRFPFLQVGDVVEVEIERLGAQRTRMIAPSVSLVE